MHKTTLIVMGLLGCSVFFAIPALAANCLKDSVLVGDVCVDLYEASVWEIPAGNTVLINKVKKGAATQAALIAAGATQRGLGATDDYPCNDPAMTVTRSMP